MSRIVSAKRSRMGAKKLNMHKFIGQLRDNRMHSSVAKVWVPDDASSHFSIDTDSGDVRIEVVLQPTLIPVTCRLVAPGGVWCIPAVDEEVAAFLFDGSLEDAICLPQLSSGFVPQNVDEDAIVLARGKVYIHDGNGGTDALATKTDIDQLTVWAAAFATAMSYLTAPPAASGTSILEAK